MCLQCPVSSHLLNPKQVSHPFDASSTVKHQEKLSTASQSVSTQLCGLLMDNWHHSTRQHWTNGLARLSQLALSFRPFGSFLSFGCSDCLQSSNLLDASLDPFWLSAGFNTVVCLKWRHQQSRFEQVECRNGFMSVAFGKRPPDRWHLVHCLNSK